MTERRADASPLPIERLQRPASERDIRDLAALLIDAVDSNAAVTFLAPLQPAQAEDWWRKLLQDASPRAIFLVVRDAGGIVATVQLHPPAAVNQQHRAEIAKLLVHRRARRRGLGRALMRTIEAQARSAGFELLTLDTKRGDGADYLYRAEGWTALGAIPRYAFDPDGTPHDAVIFYKTLA